MTGAMAEGLTVVAKPILKADLTSAVCRALESARRA